MGEGAGQDYQGPMSGLPGTISCQVWGQQCNNFYKMANFSFYPYILTQIV